MTNAEDANQVCPFCSALNPLNATRCISCGAVLSSSLRAHAAASGEPDEALKHVPVENRVTIARYERDTEAELAAGLLRSSGIACELEPMIIPGLAADMSLWVKARDAEAARRILAEVEESAETEDEGDDDSDA
jgi:ribosomal protein L40E